jgi:hypothetical protein
MGGITLLKLLKELDIPISEELLLKESLTFRPQLIYLNSSNVNKIDGYKILGGLAIDVLFFHISFLYINQNAKEIGRLYKSCENKHDIVQILCNKLFDYKLIEYGKFEHGKASELQVLYQFVGFIYAKKGYDFIFNISKFEVLNYLTSLSKQPIQNYRKLLDEYIYKNFNFWPKYNVNEKSNFYERDIIYEAKLSINNTELSDIGISKNNSRENVAKKYIENYISKTVINEIAPAIEIHQLSVPNFPNELIIKMQKDNFKLKSLNIDENLLTICLTHRSAQKNIIKENLEKNTIRSISLLGSKVSLLFNYEYNLKAEKFNDIELLNYDFMFPRNLSKHDVITSLENLIFSTGLYNKLFNSLNINELIILNKNELNEKLYKSFINATLGAFFISNFDSFNKYKYIFKEELKYIFSNKYKETEETSEVVAKKFLNDLCYKIEINKNYITENQHEIIIEAKGNGHNLIWQAKGNNKEALNEIYSKIINDYILCVDSIFNNKSFSERFSHIYLNAFISQLNSISEESMLNILVNYKYLTTNQIKYTGVNDFVDYVVLVYKRIIELTDVSPETFLNIYLKTGAFKYISCFNKIISFKTLILIINEVLHNINLYKNSDNKQIYKYIEYSISKLDSIYEENIDINEVINPSEQFIKKKIENNWMNIQYVSEPSYEIQKFAIDINIDAFKYINNPNKKIFEYIDKKRNVFEIDTLSKFYINIESPIDLSPENCKIHLLDCGRSFNKQLYKLCESIDPVSLSLGCGYVFQSGLYFLDDIINKVLMNNGNFTLLIGSLQSYYKSRENSNKITGIDKNSAHKISSYFQYKNFSLYTYTESFYHGKYYCITGKEKSIIVIGSSNISNFAFNSNIELNIAFEVKNTYKLAQTFNTWFSNLIFQSAKIDKLDLSLFSEREFNVEDILVIKKIPLNVMQRKINTLTNEETKYRLNLWMQKKPTEIYDDLSIESLKGYIGFYFDENSLLVLESFSFGNSYYCIITKEKSIEKLINEIRNLSKNEIFNLSSMHKRGYHIKNKFNLELNINSFFENEK